MISKKCWHRTESLIYVFIALEDHLESPRPWSPVSALKHKVEYEKYQEQAGKIRQGKEHKKIHSDKRHLLVDKLSSVSLSTILEEFQSEKAAGFGA